MQKLADGVRNYAAPVVVEDAEPDAPTCPTCDGLGYVRYDVPIDHPLFGKLVNCTNPDCTAVKERQQQRHAKLIEQVRLPAEYAALTFASWETLMQTEPDKMRGKWDAWGMAQAFVAAKERHFMFSPCDAARLVDERVAELLSTERRRERQRLYPEPYADYAALDIGLKNSIVFTGVNGVGKTSLGSSVAQVLVEQQIPVLYARTADLLMAVRERFDVTQRQQGFEFDWGTSEAAIISLFQTVPVLVLDEFGVEQYTDWRRDIMQAVVRYRYAHQMATIFTTNLGYDEMSSETRWRRATGDAVHGMAHWVQMSGDELRRRNGVWGSR